MSDEESISAQACILPHMEGMWVSFTAAKVALGVSRRRVYQLAEAGYLTRWYHERTGKLGFSLTEIDEYVNRDRPEPAARPRDDFGRFVSATR